MSRVMFVVKPFKFVAAAWGFRRNMAFRVVLLVEHDIVWLLSSPVLRVNSEKLCRVL